MHPSRRRQPGMGLMLLFYQLFGVIGIDRIPPVTLGIIGLQVASFLRLFRVPWYDTRHACVSAYKVWRKKEYMRLLYAAFEHADDWHLYYNMCSFALKGQSLERRFGSKRFLYIISVFTILTNVVLVALHLLAGEFFKENGIEDQCAIGFSGVIFALKVLTTYYDHNYAQQVMGIPIIVSARYAVWLELLLIQMFVPNASFFGHLAGILVGMAYVKGPLKYFMDLLYSLISKIISPSPTPRFTPRAEPSGYASASYREYVPSGMSEEEQLRRAMEESLHEDPHSSHNNVPPYSTSFHSGYSAPPPPGFFFDNASPPPPGFMPDTEELRNRRQAHFMSR
ncbi:rhomboid-related protein 4-like [Stegodyphus dumicola]|uniref:rhomboid-related protein 4-like n=1 Tax=Stegodyphus dumicola TaxID=202533 RepID=UPI0015AC402A|nr:rhomboid-related protein 4-like [Stegodyphus dumicola]